MATKNIEYRGEKLILKGQNVYFCGEIVHACEKFTFSNNFKVDQIALSYVVKLRHDK